MADDQPVTKENQLSWDYLINEKKQDFIAEKDLNTARCRVWGLSRSPLGSYIAIIMW